MYVHNNQNSGMRHEQVSSSMWTSPLMGCMATPTMRTTCITPSSQGLLWAKVWDTKTLVEIRKLQK